MKAIFITATDTGAGKTVVCGLLSRFLKDKGYKVITQKWIQTGSSFTEDINTHLKIMKASKKLYKQYLKYMCPYLFKFASSPHLAAELENKKIKPQKIEDSFKYLLNKFEFVIVEGTGGLLVPYSRNNLILEIVKKLNLSVLVVVANRLGAINHTLLTLKVLKTEKIKVLGLVFNNLFTSQNRIILKDNIKFIGEFTKENILGVLPYRKNFDLLYKDFSSIGENFVKLLKYE